MHHNLALQFALTVRMDNIAQRLVLALAHYALQEVIQAHLGPLFAYYAMRATIAQ
jgi:hypothetical protein